MIEQSISLVSHLVVVALNVLCAVEKEVDSLLEELLKTVSGSLVGCYHVMCAV